MQDWLSLSNAIDNFTFKTVGRGLLAICVLHIFFTTELSAAMIFHVQDNSSEENVIKSNLISIKSHSSGERWAPHSVTAHASVLVHISSNITKFWYWKLSSGYYVFGIKKGAFMYYVTYTGIISFCITEIFILI